MEDSDTIQENAPTKEKVKEAKVEEKDRKEDVSRVEEGTFRRTAQREKAKGKVQKLVALGAEEHTTKTNALREKEKQD